MIRCNLYKEVFSTLKGICPHPQCGRVYWGWALAQSEEQFCGQCGAPLLISTSIENKIEGRKPWKKETIWGKILKAIKPGGFGDQRGLSKSLLSFYFGVGKIKELNSYQLNV